MNPLHKVASAFKLIFVLLLAVTGLSLPGQSATGPSATPVPLGAPVSLSVTADGTPPFSYQWRKNGTPIPAATSDTFAIPAFNLTFSGTYDVIVSNSAGSDTAPAVVIAILTVKPSNSKIGVAVGLAPSTAGAK